MPCLPPANVVSVKIAFAGAVKFSPDARLFRLRAVRRPQAAPGRVPRCHCRGVTPYAARNRLEKKLGFAKPHARAVAAMVV
jgi:hypothetical protein